MSCLGMQGISLNVALVGWKLDGGSCLKNDLKLLCVPTMIMACFTLHNFLKFI